MAESILKKAQSDVIRRLKQNRSMRSIYRALSRCNRKTCSPSCRTAACRYKERRLYLSSRAKIKNLLKQAPQPLFEVNVVRSSCSQKFGQLKKISIRATEQVVRRALDKLYDPQIVAVGMIRVLAWPYRGGHWICEAHLIVAGADQDELKKRLFGKRYHGLLPHLVWVRPVKNAGASLRRVFRLDPDVWENPRFRSRSPERAKKAQRAEYYAWLVSLASNATLLRYGCDRYFNKLRKKQRVRPSLVKKKRPYPHHLKPYMFGGDGVWRDRDAQDEKYKPKQMGK